MEQRFWVGKIPVTRLRPGLYRVHLSVSYFGQVVRVNKAWWRGELRDRASGALLRYADGSTTWRGAILDLIDGWMDADGTLERAHAEG